MPKVISRFTVSASSDTKPTPSEAAALRVYYCICGEFILVIDRNISSLPRRRSDDAIIVRSQDSESAEARVFKLNAVSTDPIIVQREKGSEKQFRYNCPRCALPVAYETGPKGFMYLIRGALTQMQGQIPKDAFDGEAATKNGI